MPARTPPTRVTDTRTSSGVHPSAVTSASCRARVPLRHGGRLVRPQVHRYDNHGSRPDERGPMFENWPFAEPEDLAVFTLKRIVRGESPILMVSHDEDDGGWQFT